MAKSAMTIKVFIRRSFLEKPNTAKRQSLLHMSLGGTIPPLESVRLACPPSVARRCAQRTSLPIFDLGQVMIGALQLLKPFATILVEGPSC
ncbi:MAG: hypothetical protein WBM12_01720 [Pseudolabrys sp.]